MVLSCLGSVVSWLVSVVVYSCGPVASTDGMRVVVGYSCDPVAPSDGMRVVPLTFTLIIIV